MLLLLADDGVLGDLLRGRVGQGSAGELLQLAQLVETGIPLVVRHALSLSVVIGVAGLVELANELLHPQYSIVCHKYLLLFANAKVRKYLEIGKILRTFAHDLTKHSEKRCINCSLN